VFYYLLIQVKCEKIRCYICFGCLLLFKEYKHCYMSAIFCIQNKLNFFFTKKIQLAILKIKDLYFIWQNFSGKMFGSWLRVRVRVMVFNATINNISATLRWSVFLVGPRKSINYPGPLCSWSYGSRCVHDSMVVVFTTTYAISVYHHWLWIPLMARCTHYVIKFVSYLLQISGFLRILWFSPPRKLTTAM
jgi:hypothetical protein